MFMLTHVNGTVTDTYAGFSYETCLRVIDMRLFLLTSVLQLLTHVSVLVTDTCLHVTGMRLFLLTSVVKLLTRVSVLGTDTCRYVADTCLCVPW